jgi:hypothetical protein
MHGTSCAITKNTAGDRERTPSLYTLYAVRESYPTDVPPRKAGGSLVRLNRKDADDSYLIINGNLVNRGRPRAFQTETNRPSRDTYNFEFARDDTGSDGLAYIQSADFGLPVVEAQTEDGQPAWFNPRKVVVEDLTEDTCHKSEAERIRPEACVQLSRAMTAFGAGPDLDSLVEEWYRDDIAQVLLRFVTAPFNINTTSFKRGIMPAATTPSSVRSGTTSSWSRSSVSGPTPKAAGSRSLTGLFTTILAFEPSCAGR